MENNKELEQPEVKKTEELEPGQEILFEQCYFAGRVAKSDNSYEITFGIRGGISTSFTFTDELEAKGAFIALENAYTIALGKMQEAFVDAYDLNN